MYFLSLSRYSFFRTLIMSYFSKRDLFNLCSFFPLEWQHWTWLWLLCWVEFFFDWALLWDFLSSLTSQSRELSRGRVVVSGGLWFWGVKSHLYRVTREAANSPLQTCTESLRLLPGSVEAAAASLQPMVEIIRPQNKFGKPTSTQRAVSHRCFKALADS